MFPLCLNQWLLTIIVAFETSKGTLSHGSFARDNFVGCYTIIKPPLHYVNVVYAHTGAVPHYQVSQEELDHFFEANGTPIFQGNDMLNPAAIQVFGPNVDLCCCKICFRDIGLHLLESMGNQDFDNQEQAVFQDYFFTSSQGETCLSMAFEDGLPSPSLHDGRADPFILDLGNQVSMVICHCIFNGTFPKEWFNLPSESRSIFSDRIGSNVIFEAMRLTMTNQQHCCLPHVGRNNDPCVPGFVLIAKIVTIDEQQWRVAIVLYTRKGIANYMKRRATLGMDTCSVVAYVKDCKEEQVSNAFHSLELHDNVLSYKGLKIHEKDMTLDPLSFLSLSLFLIIVAFHCLSLNKVQVCSLLVAWCVGGFACYPYFFVHAMLKLIITGTDQCDFGYHVHKEICQQRC